MNSVDNILEAHSLSNSRLTVRTFTTEDEDFPQQFVLLEGSSENLRFLGEFILAHVGAGSTCSWSLHPNGAGNVHFSNESTIGIFLHKLPCDLHPANTVK